MRRKAASKAYVMACQWRGGSVEISRYHKQRGMRQSASKRQRRRRKPGRNQSWRGVKQQMLARTQRHQNSLRHNISKQHYRVALFIVARRRAQRCCLRHAHQNLGSSIFSCAWRAWRRPGARTWRVTLALERHLAWAGAAASIANAARSRRVETTP